MVTTLAALRLLPNRWSLRGKPVCDRSLPALTIAVLVLVIWFIKSVIPYHVIGFDHPAHAEFRILHVQKTGMRIQETTILGLHNGTLYEWQTDRRLLQYRFPIRSTITAIGGTLFDRA